MVDGSIPGERVAKWTTLMHSVFIGLAVGGGAEGGAGAGAGAGALANFSVLHAVVALRGRALIPFALPPVDNSSKAILFAFGGEAAAAAAITPQLPGDAAWVRSTRVPSTAPPLGVRPQLAADVEKFHRVLALSVKRDADAQLLGACGWNADISMHTGASFVARGLLSLEREGAFCDKATEYARLLALAEALDTTPLVVQHVENRLPGSIDCDLTEYEALHEAIGGAPNDDARRALLTRPVDKTFYNGLVPVYDEDDYIVYFVWSCEIAVKRGSLRAGAPESAAHAAKRKGGLDAVDPVNFLARVGCGTPKRANSFGVPTIVLTLPKWLSGKIGEDNIDGRHVLVAHEALVMGGHGFLRLPGDKMWGDAGTMEGSAFGGRAGMAAQALYAREASDDTGVVKYAALVSQGAAIMGALPTPPPHTPAPTPPARPGITPTPLTPPPVLICPNFIAATSRNDAAERGELAASGPRKGLPIKTTSAMGASVSPSAPRTPLPVAPALQLRSALGTSALEIHHPILTGAPRPTPLTLSLDSPPSLHSGTKNGADATAATQMRGAMSVAESAAAAAVAERLTSGGAGPRRFARAIRAAPLSEEEKAHALAYARGVQTQDAGASPQRPHTRAPSPRATPRRPACRFREINPTPLTPRPPPTTPPAANSCSFTPEGEARCGCTKFGLDSGCDCPEKGHLHMQQAAAAGAFSRLPSRPLPIAPPPPPPRVAPRSARGEVRLKIEGN